LKIVASFTAMLVMFVTLEVNILKRYSAGLKVGDTVTVIKNGPSIRFLINGEDQGEAINNAEGEMYPVVESWRTGDSVMIVPNP
jgi:hypothetical protein